MLLAIRDRITGIVAWTIVVLISIPFMLWGVQEYFGMGEEQFAVKVNDREVSMREFDRAMAQSRQRLAQSFGGSIPDYFDADAFLREQTLTQLTNRELIVETLEADRYRVPAQLVGDRIMQDPRFQTDGQFNPEIYEADLRQQGVGKQEYERQKMHELASQQFQRGVQNTAFVPRAELTDYARLRYQTRGFEFVRLALSGFRGDLEPPDEEAIAAYYEDNKSDFQTEEKVRARYVELSLQDLADRVTVDEQTLRQQYEDAVANGRYRTDEVREARHILIEVPQDASEEQLEESRQQILELRKRIEQGAEFAEVAREHSDDTGSAEQGGSLGEVRSGDMVKPFEDALFSLQPDELSEPVKTRFGFHLIKVDDIQPHETEPFDAVRDELESDYRRREAESIFFDRLDILANEAFENSGTLEPAAEAIGTEVRESDFFTRRQPADEDGISSHSEVREAAFSDSVLLDGRNSELIEIGQDHVVVVRVAEHQPSRPSTLEEAREQIKTAIENQRAREALEEVADTLESRLREGASPAALAEDHPHAEYEQVEDVERDASQPDSEIVQAAFRMPTPSEDASVRRISLGNGDAALIRLTEVSDGSLQALEGQERREFVDRLVQGRGQHDFQALLAHLKAEADVVLHEDLRQNGQ